MKDTTIFKRRETEYTGGDDVNGNFIPKQRVTIGRCVNEDEDIWTVTDAYGKTHRVDGCDLSPHPESALTNEEFIVLVMNWAKTPLMQPFILLGAEHYAKQVLAASDEELTTGFMNGAAWKEVAREYLGWAAARQLVEEEKRKAYAPAD